MNLPIHLLCQKSNSLGDCDGIDIAQAFIWCSTHFIERRDLPVKILLDNGFTFKAADKMISFILNHPTVEEYFAGAHVPSISKPPGEAESLSVWKVSEEMSLQDHQKKEVVPR